MAGLRKRMMNKLKEGQDLTDAKVGEVYTGVQELKSGQKSELDAIKSQSNVTWQP